jgi:hypothetical protein
MASLWRGFKGMGVRYWEVIAGCYWLERGRGEEFGEEMKPTGGVHLEVREREGEGYRFGIFPGWAEAEMFAGPDLFPVAFYPFLISFSFSVFLFLLYLLQKCFKSIQTTFINFVKFTARF